MGAWRRCGCAVHASKFNDDMMHWTFGDFGADQFWISRDDLSAQKLARREDDIRVPLAHVPEEWEPVFRQGHAPSWRFRACRHC
jgi:peroxiredoxin